MIRLLAALLLLASLSSCAAAVAGAGAAVGVWAYDRHSDAGGEIVLASPPEQVFAASEAVATRRGTRVHADAGAQRVECRMGEVEVHFVVVVVPGAENVARLRVWAYDGLIGKAELARDLAHDVELRLDQGRQAGA